jgi:glutathione S-transferase
MVHYKVIYFNGRGRAETMRLIFAAAGVEYEDHRIERADWPTAKAELKLPFGQVPALEVDGVMLGQSNACARYIARQFHLAGTTELEHAQADMIVDCFDDAVKPLMQLFTEKDETKKAELKKKYADEQLPGYLTQLEALLAANHGGDHYFVGKELTWTDLAFLNFVGWTITFGGVENPLAKFPKLTALHHKVENLPKIAAWIAKRPKTEM